MPPKIFVLQLTRKKSILLVVLLWGVASPGDASTELKTTSKNDFLRSYCSTNVKITNLSSAFEDPTARR